LCKVLEVTRSAYYRYLLKPKNNVALDVKLIVELKALHKISKQSYGTRRMTKALLDQGYNIGRFKVRRLMRQNGISCKQRRRYTVTTQSKHELVIANNLLNREFNVTRPNEKWVSDITYLWTLEGWLYVAAVLDLFSRRVIGWAISDNMKTDLVENAFEMARRRRQPTVGFLHHSDRGVQYASERYQMLLKKSGAVVSMSRKGNCWDNAVMERFFGSMKSECTDGKIYFTKSEAINDVIDFIENFYNSQRLHSTLNYMSPAAYEKLYAMNRNYVPVN
jgi:transposase InsO family protein